MAVGAVVDDLGLAVRPDDEQRRHLALTNSGREFDVDFAAVIVGADRTPGWSVALDGITRAALSLIWNKRRRWQTPTATNPILRIEPGDRWHIGLFARSQFDQIGPPVGVDDELGLDGRPRRLYHDMHTP